MFLGVNFVNFDLPPYKKQSPLAPVAAPCHPQADRRNRRRIRAQYPRAERYRNRLRQCPDGRILAIGKAAFGTDQDRCRTVMRDQCFAKTAFPAFMDTLIREE